jgi:hypothetical protein
MDYASMSEQALTAIVREAENQNSTPRPTGGRVLTEQAKREITAELRRRASQNSQG